MTPTPIVRVIIAGAFGCGAVVGHLVSSWWEVAMNVAICSLICLAFWLGER